MKHSIKLTLVFGLLLGVLLSGCGGDDKKKDESTTAAGGQTPARATPHITSTPRPPAPRSKDIPSEDPKHFEAPLSVGNFVRETMTGSPTGTQTGGLQATYSGGIVLSIYYFDRPDQAVDSVRFALESSGIVEQVEKPFYDPVVAYGVGRDQHGVYMAAWSHYEWFFMVRTAGDLDVLNSFMETFPY
jgi:hypothetical protein